MRVAPGTYETQLQPEEQDAFEAWATDTPGVVWLGSVPEDDGTTWYAVRVTRALDWDSPVGGAPVAIVGSEVPDADEGDGGKGNGPGGIGWLGWLDGRQLVTGLVVAVAGAYLTKRLLEDK